MVVTLLKGAFRVSFVTAPLLLCTTAFPTQAALRLKERVAQRCQALFHATGLAMMRRMVMSFR
jgi:hypothetical protein